MKRLIRMSTLILVVALTAFPQRGHAQIFDAIQEAIRRALMAADVAVQKVQNATLDLQNIQKEVENELSKLNLQDISDWEQKQKDLYGQYFDELWKVKTFITYFRQITTIIDEQKNLVSEYKQAYSRVRNDKNFSAAEVSYIYNVFTNIIAESVKSVDQISNLLTSYSFQISDAARLKLLQQSSREIDQQIADLRAFNNQTAQISLQRAKTLSELNTVKSLYGLPNN